MARLNGKRKKNWRYAFIFGLLSLICIVAVAAWFADKRASTPALPKVGNSTTNIDLRGTWVGEANNLLDIRPDGTGRSRISSKPANGISFFRWRFDPDSQKFTLIETSNNILANLRDRYIGEDAFDFTIEVESPSSFNLVNPTNGHKQRFVRTEDKSVAMAP